MSFNLKKIIAFLPLCMLLLFACEGGSDTSRDDNIVSDNDSSLLDDDYKIFPDPDTSETTDLDSKSEEVDNETVDLSEGETFDDFEEPLDEDNYQPPTGLQDWEMYLTVDNMFDVYFGNPYKTTGEVVGRGNSWGKEYYFEAKGRAATDYMYVATASDHSTAQGFIGTFKNTTLNKVTNTGDDVWDVFPAGAYQETNPYWPDPWPASVMPTQEQVDTAITFAQTNNLWVTPVYPEGYDNDPETPIAAGRKEWGSIYANIPKEAKWIWHDCQRSTATSGWVVPLAQFNHDEFLVFRVPGKIIIPK